MVKKKPAALFTPNRIAIRHLPPDAAEKLHLRFTAEATTGVQRLLTEVSGGHASLQILMLLSSCNLLQENIRKEKGRTWVGRSVEEMAAATNLSVPTIQRRIRSLCEGVPGVQRPFLIRGKRSHGRLCYGIHEYMFGHEKVTTKDRARAHYGMPAYGKFNARLAMLVNDKLVRDSDYPGSLAVLLWFICETTSMKMNSENWIPVTQGDLAKVLHMKKDRIRSGFKLLREENVLKKHPDRWSYRISNRFYQCGKKNFDEK